MKNNKVRGDQPNFQPRCAVWVLLSAIITGSLALRVPGLDWLVGFGPTNDYSFRLDDQRFVDLAKNFLAGMVDGYVHGMTTHLLGLEAVLGPFFPGQNPLQLLRAVTVIYAALTVLLVFVMARAWAIGNADALLAAFFLAAAPMHVANSNFGTADVTAVFYFYLTLFAEGKYLHTKDPLWFVLAAALTGAAIAIKFFIPLLLPLTLLIFVHRGRDLLTKALTASLVFLGCFETFSLFAYRLTDFKTLIATLRGDVISVPGGNGIVVQLVLYSWDLISGLSLPVAILLLIGLVTTTSQLARRLPSITASGTTQRDWRSFITPNSLLFSALAMHGLVIVSSGAHASRHELVYLPVACIGAACTLKTILGRYAHIPWLRPVSISILLIYGGANAIAVESLYTRDIRIDVADWTSKHIPNSRNILTFSEFSRIKGITYDHNANPQLLDTSKYILTCDTEYKAYLKSRDATTYDVYGGQKRVDFFWDVFEGKSAFRVIKVFKQAPLSIEQMLIDSQILRPVGSFVPKTCFVLGADTATNAIVERSDVWPRLYYAAGW